MSSNPFPHMLNLPSAQSVRCAQNAMCYQTSLHDDRQCIQNTQLYICKGKCLKQHLDYGVNLLVQGQIKLVPGLSRQMT